MRVLRAALATGVSALALTGVAVQAQQTSDPEASTPAARGDVVIVTATRRAQSFADIPASVSVLSGDQLAPANAFDGAEELTQLLTGVQAAVANGNQIAFQIRGVGAVDHQALTPTAAAVYVDGVFLATNVQTGPLLYDLERVEVLKGPQGTLYGRNASGGAINILTVAPSEDQTSYVRGTVGNFDRRDVTGALGLTLSDTVTARVAGRWLTQGPQLDNVVTDETAPTGPKRAGGERDEFGLRASLAWRPDAETRMLLRAHYEEDNGVNPAPRNDSLDVGDHEISVGPDGVQDTDNEFYGLSAEIKGVFNRWSVTSLTALEGYNQDYGFDFDGTQAPFGNPTLNANLSYDRDLFQLSQEIRARRPVSWGDTLWGVSAARETFDQRYLIWCGELDPQTLLGTCRYVGAPGRVGPEPASPGTATTLLTEIEQDRETLAVFSRNDVVLSEALTLTIGARYTYEEITGSGSGVHIFDDGVRALNNRDGAGPAIGANTIEENRLTGDLALSYALAPRQSVYVSLSNGYKSGGFNGEVQNNATHFQDEGLFKAETVTSLEAGYKGLIGSSLRVTAAAFALDYQDPQARIFVNFALPDGSSITSNSLSNLDEATTFGAEAELAWTPLSGLDLASSVTLLDTEIHQSDEANAALFDGNPLPFASGVSATLFARYERPLGDQLRGALQANAKYQSEFFLDAEGLEERRQDAYTTLDAQATLYLDARAVELTAWGRNLTDEDYAVSGFGFIGYNTFRSAPRTYGVSASLRF